MAFRPIYRTPSQHLLWMPVDRVTGTSLYVGQLVKCDNVNLNGAAPLAVASGAGDASSDQTIFGVVVGTSDHTATFDATYGQYQASAAATQAANLARRNLGVSGMHPKGDPCGMVQIARIFADTVLEGNIYLTTIGTAPTLLTATTASTDGLGFTTNTCGMTMTSTGNLSTTYCRTGANAGMYRVNSDTSATVAVFATPWPYDVAIGDTFVRVPFRQGTCWANINDDAGYIGMFLDAALNEATNYYKIDVHALDLRTAGKERAIFTFNGAHFAAK